MPRIMLCLLLLFSTGGAQADILQTSNPLMTEIQITAESFGDPVVDSLAAYKNEVARSAYTTTLQLCEGYRRARNLGPHPYHQRWMYTFEQAMGSWAFVAREGALQPLSAIGGLKADYLSLQNIGFFDFESWFGSMYSLYLVNSLGFLAGAMHCLDTMDESEINYFAATILIVDYEMSLATHAGLSVTTTQVFSWVAQSTRYVWRPLTLLLNTARIRIPPTPLKVAGLTLGYILADNLFIYIKQRNESSAILRELLTEGSALNGDSQKRSRFLLLNHAYEIALTQQRLESRLRTENQYIDENLIYQVFYEYLENNFNATILRNMNQDLVEFQSRSGLSPQEVAYQQLLEAFLPIIEDVMQSKNLL